MFILQLIFVSYWRALRFMKKCTLLLAKNENVCICARKRLLLANTMVTGCSLVTRL